MDKMTEEDIKKVEKQLGEPVFISFTDEVHRARRNLIILTFVTLAYKISGAKITSFAPLGIHFDNFQPDFVDTAFFIFTLYSFIHFFWLSLDALQEAHKNNGYTLVLCHHRKNGRRICRLSK